MSALRDFDPDDEAHLTMVQIVQRRDEKIARLQSHLRYATDEIEAMRKEMARSLPDVSSYIDVAPTTYRGVPGVVIDGPRSFMSLEPLWAVPAKDRGSARHRLVEEAARIHLSVVYEKILGAAEKAQKQP